MRVLITSVPAGSGHVRAAEALQAAFQRDAPGHLAVHVNVMDFVTPAFRRLYVEGYRVAVNRAPSLWGKLYNFWDHRPSDGALAPLLYRAQHSRSRAFFEYLDRFAPDVILTTHFLVPQLLMADPRFRLRRPAVETVITDYDLHRFWVSDAVSRYHVAHDGLAAGLLAQGVPAHRVNVSGIPVHPCFLESSSPSSLLRSLGLQLSRPTVLVLAGGLGLQQFREAVEPLWRLPFPTQLVTVAGKNEQLRQALNALEPPSHITLRNLGFVHNMQDLMTISNVVITKPGGLTVTECLAKTKPMILFSPIPGQEERNAEFLTQQGAALRVQSARELPMAVASVLTNRVLRQRLVANIRRIARPNAAFTILHSLLQTAILAA